VAVAPEGAFARLSAAINRPKKRALGVFKLESEFVGIVRSGEFEIWERREHAIHAIGRMRGRRGGTRIDVRFVLTPRARVLGAAFFGLYALLAVGFALQPGDPGRTATNVFVLVLGAATVAGIFIAGTRKQRADLRSFIDRLFADLPRI
jgi:hypothetical protein